ncbi:30S ribosomal protein S10 [Candidatus Peregrinibacteria bacterium]|nr:30S ribosomal protein S10 [Candidatus Peregrinibacteria bacterium]
MNPSKKESPASTKATAAKPKKPAKKSAKDIAETAVSGVKKEKKGGETKVQSIRIRLSAFDHIVLDEAAGKIIDTAQRSGAVVHGPIPLPTHVRKFTINRSTFKHKDARDQFEMRIHRRLIDLTETTFKTIESLQSLSLPSGVDIEIKMG